MISNTKVTVGDAIQTITRMDYTVAKTVGYPKNSISSSTRSLTAQVRVLTCSRQGRGNFVSPVGQNYMVTSDEVYTGTMIKQTIYSDAGSGYIITNTETGPTGAGVGVVALPFDANVTHNNVLGKLSDTVRGNLDLSVDLAEASKTRAMLANVGKMETYIKDFQGKHKTIANRYLEFIFGWKPLISTLYGTATEINNALPSAQRLVKRSSQRVTQDYISLGANRDTRVRYSHSHRIEYGFVFKPPSAVLNQLARFTSLNPASIAWELMPYSFLIDYIVDFGGYLRNMETAMIHAGSVSYGWKTITERKQSDGTIIGNGKSAYYGATVHTGSLTARSYTQAKIRSPISAWPFPAKPTFKVRLGVTRLLNVAALLTQLLPSPARPKAANKRRLVSNLVLSKRRKAKDRIWRQTRVQIQKTKSLA